MSREKEIVTGLISVIMPVYNSQAYLDEAIQSILNQTYRKFEFIIINDGSTDNSLEIIKKYKEEDDRIILIDREKRGLIKSLNEGISNTKGQYIARMDSDDVSSPNRFEKQFEFMETNQDIGVCGTWIKIFGDNINTKLGRPSNDDETLKTTLLFSVPFPHPSVMMRSNAIKGKYEYNLDYDSIEDYKLWLDMSKTTKFSTVTEILLKYRYVLTSKSHIAEKDFHQRFLSTRKIFSEVILSLGMINTDEEDKIHFIMGLNERIASNDLEVDKVTKYLIKILDYNRENNLFHKKKLKRLLLKRYIVFIYFKVKRLQLRFLIILFSLKFWNNFFTLCMK